MAIKVERPLTLPGTEIKEDTYPDATIFTWDDDGDLSVKKDGKIVAAYPRGEWTRATVVEE